MFWPSMNERLEMYSFMEICTVMSVLSFKLQYKHICCQLISLRYVCFLNSSSSAALMNINFYVVVPVLVLSHVIAFGIGLVVWIVICRKLQWWCMQFGGHLKYVWYLRDGFLDLSLHFSLFHFYLTTWCVSVKEIV